MFRRFIQGGQNTNTVKWQSPINQSVSQYNITVNVSDGSQISKKTEIAYVAAATIGYLEGYTYYSGTTIPVSGVLVSIENKNYTTDNNGYYRLDTLTSGNKILNATKEGYDQFQTNINIVQGQNTKNILMTSALYTHNLYGYITYATTQQAIQSVTVTVLNENGSDSQLQTTSDYNGYYQVPTVPQGQRKVKFQKQNYQIITPQIFMSNSDYHYNAQLVNKPGIPSDPAPADNATGQPRTLTLSWACVDPNGDPLTYDIYFGTTNPPTQVVSSNQSTTTLERTNLVYNTIYYWKVKAKDGYNNSTESPVWKFTISIGPCNGVTQVDYPGGPYNTVAIDDQCWLTKNLNIGQMIPGSQLPSNPSLIEKYCYSNDTANCTTYGGLYTWNEAMQNSTTPGVQGICPPSWHIPTYAQLQALRDAVGENGNALKREDQGSGSGQGTNTSGFSALLAGYRTSNGFFHDLGSDASFWSSTEDDATGAYYVNLFNGSSNIYLSYNGKEDGFSVRCLKD